MTPDPVDPPQGDDTKYVTEEQLSSKFDEFFERLKTLGIKTEEVTVDDDDDVIDDDSGFTGVTMKEIEDYFEKKTQEIIATLKPKRSPKTAKAIDTKPTDAPKPVEPLPREANHKTLQQHMQRFIFGKTDETVS